MSKKKLLAIILIIIGILIISISGYAIIQGKNTKESKKNKEPEKAEQIEETEENTNTPIEKLNENEDWIIEAQYERNIVNHEKRLISADEIKVPYINVNSEYAKKANEEIKATFDEAIRTYNNEVNDYAFTLDECDYYKYIGKNLASTITVYSYHLTDVPKPNYKTYNISLKTGKEMTYEEVYKELGYNKDNIEQFAEKAIISKLKEYIDKLDFVTENEYKNYKNESINNYKKSLKDKTLQYFVNEDGKLSIIVKLIFPVGVGEFNKIVTIN
ncbi:MAG: hypothetical protein SPJ06_01710 [Bacilli bacterium]|nr:hypothetical protein [Bacilli bacterium]